jgi:hypothetical protein
MRTASAILAMSGRHFRKIPKKYTQKAEKCCFFSDLGDFGVPFWHSRADFGDLRPRFSKF